MDRLQVDFVYNRNFSSLLLQDGAKFIRMTFMTDTWTSKDLWFTSFNNGHVINNFITHIVDLTGFLKARLGRESTMRSNPLESWATNSQGRCFVGKGIQRWSLIKICSCMIRIWTRHSESMSPEKLHTEIRFVLQSWNCLMLFHGDASPEALEIEI